MDQFDILQWMRNSYDHIQGGASHAWSLPSTFLDKKYMYIKKNKKIPTTILFFFFWTMW